MSLLCRTTLLWLLAAGFAAGQYKRVNVPIGPRDVDGTMHLYLFDSRRTTFEVIDQGRPQGRAYNGLGAAMEAHQCVAGCNGGPADSQGSPLGLVIAEGRKYGQPAEGTSEVEGVFFLDGSEPRLKRSAAYFTNGIATPRQLVQSGPILVENGAAVAGLDDRRIARRTFVLTDGGNRWAIGYAPATSLHKLALALADSTSFRDFDVETALNLGGSSHAAIWVKREHGPLYLKEIRPARNFIGLVRR